MVTRSIYANAEHKSSRRRCPGHRRQRAYIEFISKGPRSLINPSAGKSRLTENRRCQVSRKVKSTTRQKKKFDNSSIYN